MLPGAGATRAHRADADEAPAKDGGVAAKEKAASTFRAGGSGTNNQLEEALTLTPTLSGRGGANGHSGA